MNYIILNEKKMITCPPSQFLWEMFQGQVSDWYQRIQGHPKVVQE